MNCFLTYTNTRAKKMYEGHKFYSTEGSIGMDLMALDDITLFPNEREIVHTGVRIAVCEPEIAGFIYSRSGLGASKGIVVAQGVGVIDQDYRGEVLVCLHNTNSELPYYTVRSGDRIAQLVFHHIFKMDIKTIDESYKGFHNVFDETKRGDGGFGSTGR